MEAKEDMAKQYGDDEEQIPSLASDFSLLTQYSFSFGIPKSEILLKVIARIFILEFLTRKTGSRVASQKEKICHL